MSFYWVITEMAAVTVLGVCCALFIESCRGNTLRVIGGVVAEQLFIAAVATLVIVWGTVFFTAVAMFYDHVVSGSAPISGYWEFFTTYYGWVLPTVVWLLCMRWAFEGVIDTLEYKSHRRYETVSI